MSDFTCTHTAYAPAQKTQASLLNMLSVYRQRRALAAMDETQLADIGLTRKEADTEARRGFWDLPCHLIK